MSRQKDRDVLRQLAGEIAGIAAEPVQQERVRAWTALNSLRPERPMLWITEIPFGELEDRVDELRCVCEDDGLRNIERGFRIKRFTAKRLRTDEVVTDIFEVPKAIAGLDYGLEVKEHTIKQGQSSIEAHAYEAAIRDFDDIEKIRMPRVVHDEEETARRVAFYEDLFGDILAVKAYGLRLCWYAAWDDVVRWTGVTEALMDLVVRPDYIHAIMRRMTDSFLSRMDQLEAQGLLDGSNALPRIGSGAAGYTDELPREGVDPDRLRLIDLWGGATPQIFSEVSPAMHEEFALDYENEIMERCGLNYYGCCEPLHDKMSLMAKVPRLRKISISAWCDVARAAEDAAQPYVFSHKPSPAILAEDRFSVERAEADVRDRLAQSGDMPCEIIMKDISTVRCDVDRVIAWCDMAYRVVTGE